MPDRDGTGRNGQGTGQRRGNGECVEGKTTTPRPLGRLRGRRNKSTF